VEALEQARVLQEQLVQQNPGVRDFLNGLADTCDWMAWVLHQNRERPEFPDALDRSLSLAHRATELFRQLTKSYPENVSYKSSLCNTLNMIGLIQRDRNEPDEGLRAFAEALAIQEELVRNNPREVALRNDLVMTHHNTGRLLEQYGRLQEALRSYEQEQTVLEWLVQQDAGNAQFHIRRANVYGSLASVEAKLYGPDSAAKRAEELRQCVSTAATRKSYYLFQIACVYGTCAKTTGNDSAKSQDFTDQAISALRNAITEGFDDFDSMRQTADLETVRKDPRFAELPVARQ
jgi:tetratricopeptide (TPR) repeat protein